MRVFNTWTSFDLNPTGVTLPSSLQSLFELDFELNLLLKPFFGVPVVFYSQNIYRSSLFSVYKVPNLFRLGDSVPSTFQEPYLLPVTTMNSLRFN